MRKRMPACLLLLVTLTPLGGCDTVQPRHGEVVVHDRGSYARIVFSDHDRVLIREYYEPRYKGLPPGLAKKGKIPPGHAKQMMRDGRLPQDIAWRHLPHELESRLSRLPDGYVRIIVGADISILNTRTRVVLDVVEDIVHDD